MLPRPRLARGVERSGCPYVRMSVRMSEDQVKIFVPGRMSRPINGSSVLHMMMYLYETSRIYKSHVLMTYISRSTDF